MPREALHRYPGLTAMCAADSNGSAMKQTTFESFAWSRKGKVTRRERFLAEMDAVIPWRELIKLIEASPRHFDEFTNVTYLQLGSHGHLCRASLEA